jgi:hypothetical protein
LPSDICSQTATASHFLAVCRPFPAPPPKLGYFDMNGDVEVFTQRVTEYLSVTLHNASGTLAVTVPLHWRLNAGVTSPDATPRRRSCCDFWASSSRRSRSSKKVPEL